MTSARASGESGKSERVLTILLRVDAALETKARSGVHRVIVELARALPQHCTAHLVRWDRVEGHLRPIDRMEFNQLFGVGRWPVGLVPNPGARQTAYRLDTLLERSGDVWLLNPDVPIHTVDGLEILSRSISQCREYGACIASIFYDLIPATNAAYGDSRLPHLRYLAEIVRSDMLLPISRYSAASLQEFFDTPAARKANATLAAVSVVPLAEEGTYGRVEVRHERERDVILLVGAVEPRKRQVELLRAYAKARTRSSALAALELCIVGSLHPAVAQEFHKLVKRTPGARYMGFLPDSQIQALMERAAFTAFVSEDEGFGLPIAESVAAGVPCLCANFGAMDEIAEKGGCLTVDVRSADALEQGLRRLADDLNLRAQLRIAALARVPRSWADYARDIVAALRAPASGRSEARASIVDLMAAAAEDTATLQELAQSDIVVCETAAAMDRAIAAAEALLIEPILPSRWIIQGQGHTAAQAAKTLALELSAYRSRLETIRETEQRYANARRLFCPNPLANSIFLRIVITTYNRRPFVTESVRWLLKALQGRPEVELIVVDNTSTDGTAQALMDEFGSKLKLIVNSVNVGMLGNMRVCSQLLGAEYVWIVGDDDYIVPGQLDNILSVLQASVGVPVASVNFAVYHRDTFGAADSASGFISEQVPLAPNAIKTGIYPLRTVAAQHDNMFTAIYALIWRHDVLAAGYDHPFDGPPFQDLVESIPCSKILFDSYAACNALWVMPVCIVGNAHNSWTRHRPRWHGLLMAQIIALARDAGVEPTLLMRWARLQTDLFYEGVALAQDQGIDLNMHDNDCFTLSWPLYRRRLTQSA